MMVSTVRLVLELQLVTDMVAEELAVYLMWHRSVETNIPVRVMTILAAIYISWKGVNCTVQKVLVTPKELSLHVMERLRKVPV